MSMSMRRLVSVELISAAALFAIAATTLPAAVAAETCGGEGNPPCSGTFLNGYYDTAEPAAQNGSGAGDNILRLNNPTRANGTLCAMIYVFDDDEEMGACCGCPLSPDKLLSLSVQQNLTLNWVISPGITDAGVIDIISATQDHTNQEPACLSQTGCNGGCDPTERPTIVPTPHLKGYLMHNQQLAASTAGLFGFRVGESINLTEVPLADSGDPSPTELTYLQTQCSIITGNAPPNTGVCNCGPAGVE
jgi:hypothetical protein